LPGTPVRKSSRKEITTISQLRKLCAAIERTIQRQDGQDLIEYALVVAPIAFAATAGMSALATDINTAFTAIGTALTSYTG
jgi:pilus assembly protein Flp/PilA